MGRGARVVMLVMLMSHSLHAKSLWLTWELDLGSHAPPDQFVLTVSSPSGAMVPPPALFGAGGRGPGGGSGPPADARALWGLPSPSARPSWALLCTSGLSAE